VATANFLQQVESLQQQYQAKLPPVLEWDPPLSGDMDLRIAKDGRWFHEGDEIKRHSLVKLFSTILKKEGNAYFLVTPVEKWRIQVEDAPFLVVAIEHVEAKENMLSHYLFTTNMGDKVAADKDHPVWVEHDIETGEPRPYLLVRHGMPGLIHRNVYYELIDRALEYAGENKSVGIRSGGEFFKLA